MSDGVLSGLRRRRWPPLNPSDDEARLMQLAHNQALDDVREALRNPTDEQVEAIIADYAVQVALRNPTGWPRVVRAVLAAAAGGET